MSVLNKHPTFQGPSLSPSSGNDVMDDHCFLSVPMTNVPFLYGLLSQWGKVDNPTSKNIHSESLHLELWVSATQSVVYNTLSYLSSSAVAVTPLASNQSMCYSTQSFTRAVSLHFLFYGCVA